MHKKIICMFVAILIGTSIAAYSGMDFNVIDLSIASTDGEGSPG